MKINSFSDVLATRVTSNANKAYFRYKQYIMQLPRRLIYQCLKNKKKFKTKKFLTFQEMGLASLELKKLLLFQKATCKA